MSEPPSARPALSRPQGRKPLPRSPGRGFAAENPVSSPPSAQPATGPSSAHAHAFDIEWNSQAPETAGRVLLPVLGDHYGRVLESGEIQLHFDADAGEFSLHYWDHRFRIDPGHYPDIFEVLSPPAPRTAGACCSSIACRRP